MKKLIIMIAIVACLLGCEEKDELQPKPQRRLVPVDVDICEPIADPNLFDELGRKGKVILISGDGYRLAGFRRYEPDCEIVAKLIKNCTFYNLNSEGYDFIFRDNDSFKKLVADGLLIDKGIGSSAFFSLGIGSSFPGEVVK